MKAGLSIAQLAKLAKVSATAVTDLEAGRGDFSVNTLASVAKSLRLTADSLLKRNPDWVRCR